MDSKCLFEEFSVSTGSFVKVAKAVFTRPLLDSDTHSALFTSSNASLPAELRSESNSNFVSAAVGSSYALAFNTTTPVVTGATKGPKTLTFVNLLELT